MNMLYFLVGCSILLALIFLAAFFWATKTGQHDDTYTPSVRMLFDDEPKPQNDPDKCDENHI